MQEQAAQSAVLGDATGLALALAAGCDTSMVEPGDPVLHLAIRARSLDCVQLLIRHGTDLQATSAGGSTALLAAIEVGDLPIATVLLEAGASVMACNDAGLGPLQAACLKSDGQLLAALLGSLAAYPDEGLAGDEVLVAMFAAIACGSATCLSQLLEYAPARQRYRYFAGVVAGGAITEGQAVLLRDRQRVLLSPEGRDESQLRALCFLTQTGEALDGVTTMTGFSWLPPSAAMKYTPCQPSCAESSGDSWASPVWLSLISVLILPAASLPCHMAAALGQTECLELLLCSDPFAAGDTNLEGWTPLLFAASAGHGAAQFMFHTAR